MEQGQLFYRELAGLYDELFPVDPDAVHFIRRRAGGDRPVLDAACGTGAHVMALEGHGVDAYGIDNSPEMVEVARRRSAGRFEEMDMRRVASHSQRPFSLIYSIGNSVSHLPLPGDVAGFLAAAYESLAPAGKIVLQIIDVSDLDRGTVYPLPTLEGSSGRMERSYTIEGKHPGGTKDVRFEAVLIRGDEEPRRVAQKLLGIGPEHLRSLAEDAGFRDVKLSAGFGGAPYGEVDSRVAVLEGEI